MSFDIGSVIAHVTADISQFKSSMTDVARTTEGLGSRVSGVLGAVGKTAIAIGATATTSLVAISTLGIKTAGQLESAEQGFVALLGSAEKARDVMQRIKREAAATPFEIPGLTVGAQALTAITKDGNKAIDILLDVGKAVAVSGKGQAELDRVIFNLQQVASTGKVTEMDIRQFQGAIPIFNDILAAVGLTTEELKEADNSAELLFDAFKKAGAEGGIAAEGFSAQAGTFNQLLSNLKDSFGIFASDFVKNTGIFDIAKRALEGLTNFMNEHKDDAINFFNNAVKAIKEGFLAIQGFYNANKEEIDSIWQATLSIIKAVVGIIVILWNTFGKQLIMVAEGTFNFILGIIRFVLNTIAGVVNIFTKIMQGDWTGAFNAMISTAKIAFNSITQIFQGAIQAVLGILGTLFPSFRDTFEKIWKYAKDISDKIRKAISDAFDVKKRNSPSILDRLNQIVDSAHSALGNIEIPSFSANIAGNLAGFTPAPVTAGINNISIDMSGAIVSDDLSALRVGEQIGNSIVNKLKQNVRF